MKDIAQDARPRMHKHPDQVNNRDSLMLDEHTRVEQPANRKDDDRGATAGEEFANGDRGNVSGRMQELDAQVGGKPDPGGI